MSVLSWRISGASDLQSLWRTAFRPAGRIGDPFRARPWFGVLVARRAPLRRFGRRDFDGGGRFGAGAEFGPRRLSERVSERAIGEEVGASSTARSSVLTTMLLAQGQFSFANAPRVHLRGSVGRRLICFPGVSTFRDNWTVPGSFEVRFGELVFVVGDDGLVDSTGERFRVTALISLGRRCPAPRRSRHRNSIQDLLIDKGYL